MMLTPCAITVWSSFAIRVRSSAAAAAACSACRRSSSSVRASSSAFRCVMLRTTWPPKSGPQAKMIPTKTSEA